MALEEIFRREFAEPDRALVQDQVIAALQANPEKFLQAYRQHVDSFGGRYVSTDLAKELFEQYAKSRENRGRYNAAVHNAAAVLAAEQYRSILADASDPTRGGALFLTGMPGAGKTTALNSGGRILGAKGFAPGQRVIFEGQMVNPVTSIEKVGQALSAGLQASLMAILPKPEDALANTFRRFQELGRGASIDVMAQIQESLPAGLRALQKEFGDKLQISVWDVRVRSIPERFEGERGIIVIEKELQNGSVRDRLLAAAEHLRDTGAIDHDCYKQCLGQAPYGRQFGISGSDDGGLEAGPPGRGLSAGSRQAPQLDRPGQLDADRAGLGDLDLVNVCIWQLNRAAAIEHIKDASRTELVATAIADIRAAAERPMVAAAYGDVFSHPGMASARLEDAASANLDQALEELFLIKGALVDRYSAVESQDAAARLQRLDGPTPWNTFFADPADPERALMPLYGCRTPGILGVGPIDGNRAIRSEGGQALFYPIGGYDRFAQATSVIVTQSIADGLAVEEALRGQSGCAVVVASAPDAVGDVCFEVNQSLVQRAALVAPGDAGRPSVVAAVSSAEGHEAVRRLGVEGQRMGSEIVHPSAAGASWPTCAPDAIESIVREAQQKSSGRIEQAVDGERQVHHESRRESIRELRAATRDLPGSAARETQARQEKRTQSSARRI